MTDFVHAAVALGDKLDDEDLLAKMEDTDLVKCLLESCEDQKQKRKLFNTLFKIAFMMDSNVVCLPALVAFTGGVVAQEMVKAMT